MNKQIYTREALLSVYCVQDILMGAMEDKEMN